jgi:hypothetical protein
MMEQAVLEEIHDLDFFWRGSQNEPHHHEELNSMTTDLTDSQLAAFVNQYQQHEESYLMEDGITDSQIAAFAEKEEQRESNKSHLPPNVIEELEHPFNIGKLSCTSHLRYNYHKSCSVIKC